MTAIDLPPGVSISDKAILGDIQGNILRGYNMRFVRHVVVRVANQSAARAAIAAVLDGSDGTPQLTTAEVWEQGTKPPSCLNIGVTAAGLRALGLREEWLATFPDEFIQGAVRRAEKVGDVDCSAPEHWRDGLGDPDRVHLMWTIHALDSRDAIDRAATQLEAAWKRSGAFTVTARLDGATLDTYTHDPADRDTVHFGYRDSISQPRFVVDGEYAGRADSQPIASVGSVLLGRIHTDGAADVPAEHYRTSFPGVAWQMPEATEGFRRIELGVNGCFNAFRVLEQDVHEFEQFLETAADQINEELDRRRNAGEPAGPADIVWDKERVAAKLMGRWRNGVPLSLSHWTKGVSSESTFPGPGSPPPMDPETLNDFDYPDNVAELDDFSGVHCPMGSHIRRANPRGARIVQRSANYTRPLVRRGMPYGPPYDPAQPHDGHRRGLLGNFMCASLVAQYEAVMYDWINLGLQDPRVTGTNDPIIGANDPNTSRFEIPLPDAEPVVLTGFGRFTETAGAIYLFCPSVSALRFLADPSRVDVGLQAPRLDSPGRR
jgi:deferrochelatase/peroxidase EfeB